MSPKTTPPLPLLADLLSGLGIILWYALPDYTTSRPVRVVAKTMILTASAAYGIAAMRRGRLSPGEDTAPEPEPGDPGVAADPPSPRSTTDGRSGTHRGPRFRSSMRHPVRHPVVLTGAAVAFLGGSVALTVGMERLVFGVGERLADRGTRLPHTRIGLVLGVGSTAATLGAEAFRTRNRPGTDSQDPARHGKDSLDRARRHVG
ncbi:hypothetical protein ASF21_12420 [Arthrobacter sp. Leaf234]|uniref:hypothetical protein n=1 Tax=Arthrobacter sp. Leaf234 TaxID=1736303 RepID=UPI0006F8BAF1|nr:hypothetical protein [Arthrobacter sp. Leaf234]KQN99615.1 hypothetical protein ASF21_12420 [Arthrobacter sp. Leaf234]